MIEILIHPSDILSILCRAEKKWGVYVSGLTPVRDWGQSWDSDWTEIHKAAPWLNALEPAEQGDIIGNGFAYLLFESREEMESVYNRTIGDDGPNEFNDYTGEWKIYAVASDSLGHVMKENT